MGAQVLNRNRQETHPHQRLHLSQMLHHVRRAAKLPVRAQACCFCEGGRPPAAVIVATTDGVPGRRVVEYRGMAMGSTVRTGDVTKDITSPIRSLIGGELQH